MPNAKDWMHTHADLDFVLLFLDKLWKEYSRTLSETDRLRGSQDEHGKPHG